MNFLLLGIVSIIFQVVILREVVFAIAKDELSFVITVGIWIIASSIGSIAGATRRFARSAASGTVPLALFLIFIADCWFIRTLKDSIGIHYYEKTGALFSLYYSALLIIPIAFIMGLLFGLFAVYFKDEGRHGSGEGWRCFAAEAAGFVIGGAFFTYLFANYKNPFIFAAFAGLPVLPCLLTRDRTRQRIAAYITLTVIAAFYTSGSHILLNEKAVSRMFTGTNVAYHGGSHYGTVVLTEKDDEFALYQNGSLASASGNVEWNETVANLVLTSVRKPSNVLLLGGGISGIMDEVIKHGPKRLDIVELDPKVVETYMLITERSALPEPARIIYTDARKYLSGLPGKGVSYDVILMDLPEPATLSANRFYTSEFFGEILEALDKDGGFAFSIESKRDILSPAISAYNSIIVNTARSVFKSVELVPGDAMLLLCHNTESITSPEMVIDRMKQRGIATRFLTPYHVRDLLERSRMSYVDNALDTGSPVNTDLRPAAFLKKIVLEQKKFYPNLRHGITQSGGTVYRITVTCFVSIAVFAFILIRRGRKNAVLISGCVMGMSAMAGISLIYILFQIFQGYLYWKIGILTAVFMSGLAIGTAASHYLCARISPLSQRLLPAFHILWAIFFTAMIAVLKSGRLHEAEIFFYIIAGVAGLLAGIFYPVLCETMGLSGVSTERSIAFVNTVDLLGSFLGVVIITLVMVPFFGIAKASLGMAVTNFGLASLLLLAATRSR